MASNTVSLTLPLAAMRHPVCLTKFDKVCLHLCVIFATGGGAGIQAGGAENVAHNWSGWVRVRVDIHVGQANLSDDLLKQHYGGQHKRGELTVKTHSFQMHSD